MHQEASSIQERNEVIIDVSTPLNARFSTVVPLFLIFRLIANLIERNDFSSVKSIFFMVIILFLVWFVVYAWRAKPVYVPMTLSDQEIRVGKKLRYPINSIRKILIADGIRISFRSKQWYKLSTVQLKNPEDVTRIQIWAKEFQIPIEMR